jgi:acyl-CoA reductase-like NAD-dependent aldehyde dehydrogenase
MELQQEKRQIGASEDRQFIGGEWVGAAGGGTFESLDPFTATVVANIAAGGREDAARAVDAAHGAFPEWSKTPPAQRQLIFLKAAHVLKSRQDEIVNLALIVEVADEVWGS